MAVKKNNTAIKNSPKHLLGIQNLSILEAKAILDEAKKFIELNRSSSKKLDVFFRMAGSVAGGGSEAGGRPPRVRPS